MQHGSDPSSLNRSVHALSPWLVLELADSAAGRHHRESAALLAVEGACLVGGAWHLEDRLHELRGIQGAARFNSSRELRRQAARLLREARRCDAAEARLAYVDALARLVEALP